MKNWHNELRGESFYLTRDGTPGDGAAADKQGLVILFPENEVPAVLAALRQARRGARHAGAVTSAEYNREWQAAATPPGLLALHGPFALLGMDLYEADATSPALQLLSAEIEYADLDGLIRLLDARNTG